MSFAVPVMNGGYSAQFHHLILVSVYNADYFSKLLISFKLLGIEASFAQVKIDLNSVRN